MTLPRICPRESVQTDKVKAFYDHIGPRLIYSCNGADGGTQAALGPMGADCTEYAFLI